MDGFNIEIIKKNIKNLYLSVNPPNGKVKVSAPEYMTNKDIEQFLNTKLKWIKNQRDKFKNIDEIERKQYMSGEKHEYLGNKYTLNVIYTQDKNIGVKIRDNKYMDLYIQGENNMEKRERILKEWYRKELRLIIPQIIKKWEKIMELDVRDWRIKQMKTRWGSCNPKHHRIWLNLELVKKTFPCIEYVVVHEMIHFIERGHGERFHILLDEYYPNWKEIRNELNGLKI